MYRAFGETSLSPTTSTIPVPPPPSTTTGPKPDLWNDTLDWALPLGALAGSYYAFKKLSGGNTIVGALGAGVVGLPVAFFIGVGRAFR